MPFRLTSPFLQGTNGLYLTPAAWTTSPMDAFGYAKYYWFAQPIDANGNGIRQATRKFLDIGI